MYQCRAMRDEESAFIRDVSTCSGWHVRRAIPHAQHSCVSTGMHLAAAHVSPGHSLARQYDSSGISTQLCQHRTVPSKSVRFVWYQPGGGHRMVVLGFLEAYGCELESAAAATTRVSFPGNANKKSKKKEEKRTENQCSPPRACAKFDTNGTGVAIDVEGSRLTCFESGDPRHALVAVFDDQRHALWPHNSLRQNPRAVLRARNPPTPTQHPPLFLSRATPSRSSAGNASAGIHANRALVPSRQSVGTGEVPGIHQRHLPRARRPLCARHRWHHSGP
eukprot:1290054-Rhodomonas_salina.1